MHQFNNNFLIMWETTCVYKENTAYNYTTIVGIIWILSMYHASIQQYFFDYVRNHMRIPMVHTAIYYGLLHGSRIEVQELIIRIRTGLQTASTG